MIVYSLVKCIKRNIIFKGKSSAENDNARFNDHYLKMIMHSYSIDNKTNNDFFK